LTARAEKTIYFHGAGSGVADAGFHPGGGAASPTGSGPGKLLKDAVVFGLRTVLKF
jgi:hypothetical protein